MTVTRMILGANHTPDGYHLDDPTALPATDGPTVDQLQTAQRQCCMYVQKEWDCEWADNLTNFTRSKFMHDFKDFIDTALKTHCQAGLSPLIDNFRKITGTTSASSPLRLFDIRLDVGQEALMEAASSKTDAVAVQRASGWAYKCGDALAGVQIQWLSLVLSFRRVMAEGCLLAVALRAAKSMKDRKVNEHSAGVVKGLLAAKSALDTFGEDTDRPTDRPTLKHIVASWPAGVFFLSYPNFVNMVKGVYK